MANIMLVTYSGGLRTPTSLVLDNGLASLAAILQAHGHGVRIEDLNTTSLMSELALPHAQLEASELLASLRSNGNEHHTNFERIADLQSKFDLHQEQVIEAMFWRLRATAVTGDFNIVGFKCWMGDSLVAIKRWCELFRMHLPHVRIMLGGPVCQIAPDAVARFVTHFDCMVKGEGEIVVPQVLHRWDRNGSIEGLKGTVTLLGDHVIHEQSPEPVEMECLPVVSYTKEVYPVAGTREKLNFVMIDESRGCPMQCHFCVHPSYGIRWRTKTVSQILTEIRSAQASLGTTRFRLTGSYTPPRLLRSLATEVLQKGLNIEYSCFMHFAGACDDSFSLLRSSGLRAIFFGMESADEELLARYGGKRVFAKNAETTLSAATQSGIFSSVSFMYPMPFETPFSEDKTRSFIHRVFQGNPLLSPIIVNPYPFPNTSWWNRRAEFGFSFDEDNFLNSALFFKARTLLPPEMQDLMPYTLNGQTSREMGLRLGQLIRSVENAGILTNIDDTMAMIAIGSRTPLNQFKQQMAMSFMCGDTDRIQNMVDRFNLPSSSGSTELNADLDPTRPRAEP